MNKPKRARKHKDLALLGRAYLISYSSDRNHSSRHLHEASLTNIEIPLSGNEIQGSCWTDSCALAAAVTSCLVMDNLSFNHPEGLEMTSLNTSLTVITLPWSKRHDKDTGSHTILQLWCLKATTPLVTKTHPVGISSPPPADGEKTAFGPFCCHQILGLLPTDIFKGLGISISGDSGRHS